MLETSLGIALIAVGSLSMLGGFLYATNPFGIFGRKAVAAGVSESPALSTVIEAPAPMWVGDPNAQPSGNTETLDELFAEIFSLRSMLGDLSRDVRMLKSQLASVAGEDSASSRIRRVA